MTCSIALISSILLSSNSVDCNFLTSWSSPSHHLPFSMLSQNLNDLHVHVGEFLRLDCIGKVLVGFFGPTGPSTSGYSRSSSQCSHWDGATSPPG